MDQTDRVGQDHGKGNYRNHTSSGMLSSLRERSSFGSGYLTLPISSLTSAVKGKGSGSLKLLLIFFSSIFFLFLDFSLFPK